MDLPGARHAAAGRREAGAQPTRAPRSPALKWRRRQLAHTPPPALLRVVASGGGNGPECGKQESEGGVDPPIQRVPHRPGMLEVSRRLATGNTVGASETGGVANEKVRGKKRESERAAAHPGVYARPAPEMMFTWGRGLSLQRGFFPSCSWLSHKVSGIVLNSPSPGLAVTVSRSEASWHNAGCCDW